MKQLRFVRGRKYRLTKDFNDIIYGKIPVGTICVFECPNLGYAKFRLEDGRDIAVKPKLAFKIFEEASEE